MCRSEKMAMRYDDQQYSRHYHNSYLSVSKHKTAERPARKSTHAPAEAVQREKVAGKPNEECLEMSNAFKTDKKAEVKPKLGQFGDWSEHMSSSGKTYYYNCVSEVSQWEKPTDWLEYEKIHLPLEELPFRPQDNNFKRWEGSKKNRAAVHSTLAGLPSLLVDLAERHGIDLHEETALEKLKEYLKNAVKSESCDSESLPVEASTSNATSGGTPSKPKGDDSSPSSASSSSGRAAPEISLPPVGPLSTAAHDAFCRQELAGHVQGWAAQHFEAQGSVLAEVALRNSVQTGQLSTDLKCARSLVRTAEIRSTLLEQRILFVRDQYRQLDPQSKYAANPS